MFLNILLLIMATFNFNFINMILKYYNIIEIHIKIISEISILCY